MRKKIHPASGITLVEIIIGASIIAASFAAIIGVNVSITQMAHDNPARIQGAMLGEEGIEAMHILRDNGWAANIASKAMGDPYYFYWNGSTWTATTSVQAIDGMFYRTFTLNDAYRDGSNNLAASGTLDPDTKQVSIDVSWSERGATSTRTLQSYIFNTLNN